MDSILYTNSNEEFIKTICKTIQEQATENIKEKGSFTFVLSGGRTPKDIFIELALNYRNSIDWRKVHFFWLDERCVEATHEDSNYKLAYDNLLSKLNRVGSIHRIKGELKPKQAATEYKEDLLQFFGMDEVTFDFILLGMGEDGHIASLFPNSKEINLVGDMVLETERNYNGCGRITLGLNFINRSLCKVLMIKGEEKLKILKSGDSAFPVNSLENLNVIGLS